MPILRNEKWIPRAQFYEFDVHERGYYLTKCLDSFDSPLAPHALKVDFGLMHTLPYCLSEQRKVVDFGCGNADYIKYLRNNTELECEAYDGNPYTPEMTEFGKIQDLTVPFDLGTKFDCVLAINVGEYIPVEFEDIFIRNLIKHTNNAIIISWAYPDMVGVKKGVVNERDEMYVKNKFINYYGLKWAQDAEEYLRGNIATLIYLKKSLCVFTKI